jgi:hypothetical protein
VGATATGTVTDASSKKPLTEATLTARGVAPAAVTTDPAGHYVLGKLPVGPYDLADKCHDIVNVKYCHQIVNSST